MKMSTKVELPPQITNNSEYSIKTESSIADSKEFIIDMEDSVDVELGPCRPQPCRPPVPGHCTQRCHIGEIKEAA